MIRIGFKFVVQDADTDAESKHLGKSGGIYGFGREGVIVLSGSRLPFVNTKWIVCQHGLSFVLQRLSYPAPKIRQSSPLVFINSHADPV